MHRGDELFVTKSGKYYHYMDDDCPITSSILKGKKQAQKIKESEAKEKGYILCRHCAKEYTEDLAERKGCASVLFVGIACGGIFKMLSLLIV